MKVSILIETDSIHKSMTDDRKILINNDKKFCWIVFEFSAEIGSFF